MVSFTAQSLKHSVTNKIDAGKRKMIFKTKVGGLQKGKTLRLAMKHLLVHILGETYEEVTRLLQGYVENEVDMNPDNTCRENCGYYTLAKNHGCFKEQFCAQQSVCKGRIIDCNYIDSDMWVCKAVRLEIHYFFNPVNLFTKNSCNNTFGF